MTYSHFDATDIEPTPNRPCIQRVLDGPAGLETVALNLYEADPGEQLPLVYHHHEEQEEAFYVLDGTLHVETPEETYEVASDEVFAVDPGDPQLAFVPEDADEGVRVLAIGSPPVEGDAVPYEPDE